ncbi:MAG: tyrosine-type recombinase/integrase [Candidatus Coproplasma sp.]
MEEQKILELVGKILIARTNKDKEELNNYYQELIGACSSEEKEESKIGFLEFTNKEISKMNKSFSKTFTQNGRIVHYRRRIRGKNSCSYEIRYRRDGYNISVSAPDLETAKQRFIEAVNCPAGECNVITVPTTFTDFAEYYFEKFYKRRVSALTFKTETGRYNKHVKPYFGNIKIKSITPEACQNLIDDLKERGLGKTADEVYCILNGIFKTAIKHQIIKFNPLDIIVHITHERETGIAFTKEEEKRLLDSFIGTPYQLMYAVALYTGLRPNEYKTAKIDGRFIVAVNSKQKGGKTAYKKIPISPMLRPYLNEVKELNFFVPHILREKLQTIFPWHTLKDLRKTFNTRCEECGVTDVARKLFMGHSLGKLDNTYTGISDDYLLKEGEKLKY